MKNQRAQSRLCKRSSGIRHLICLALLFPSLGRGGTLEDLIGSALSSYPSIQAQQAQERAAEAGVDSAKWQFYPTASVSVEKARASASDPAYQGDSTVSTLRLQQPLWSGGRLTAGQEKAEAGVVASKAALDEARQQLALRVVQAYGDWLAAHLKIQADEKSLATHNRLRDQVRRRIEQGASAESDLTLAMGRLQLVAAELSTLRAQEETGLVRLGQLVGRRVDRAELLAMIAAPRPAGSGLQALVDRALAINPAIQKAQAQAKVQEAAVAERRADLSPEVYLRAERQYGNATYANSSPENRLFIGLSSRFGAGLSSLSNVEGAKSQHQAALAEVDVLRRVVSEQVLSDHALAVSFDRRLEAVNAALTAAGQVSESYDRQFLAGRKTWQDVMNAARELAQTEVQLADLKAAQVVATWRLAIYTDENLISGTGRPNERTPASAMGAVVRPVAAPRSEPVLTVPSPMLAASPVLSSRNERAARARTESKDGAAGWPVYLQLTRTLGSPAFAEDRDRRGTPRLVAADWARR